MQEPESGSSIRDDAVYRVELILQISIKVEGPGAASRRSAENRHAASSQRDIGQVSGQKKPVADRPAEAAPKRTVRTNSADYPKMTRYFQVRRHLALAIRCDTRNRNKRHHHEQA